MRVVYRLLVWAALAPLAGCSSEPEAPRAPVPAEPPAPVMLPAPPPVAVQPAPALPVAEAERILAGDPMALRFLAFRLLGERGLAAPDELGPRKDTNMGALLPLTAPLPPATGLERPIPPLDQLAARFGELKGGRGTPETRGAERAFMLDALLPKAPVARENLAPPDKESARRVLARLDRLAEAGLITPGEKEAEAAQVNARMDGLPETLLPPPPPPEAKKGKGTGSGSGNRVTRLPGGVSGKLEVVPSPPGIAAPKVAAGYAGPVGLHLLSMGAAGHGDKAWEALKKEFPELAPLSFRVSKADLGDLGATYRLIAGPLEAKPAETLCAAIRAKGQSCQTTPFPP